MREFKTTEDLREFLLGTPQEFGSEFHGLSGSCYSLSWKKNHWVIRINNKKIGTIEKSDIGNDLDLRDHRVIFKINYYLRNSNGVLAFVKQSLKGLTKDDL